MKNQVQLDSWINFNLIHKVNAGHCASQQSPGENWLYVFWWRWDWVGTSHTRYEQLAVPDASPVLQCLENVLHQLPTNICMQIFKFAYFWLSKVPIASCIIDSLLRPFNFWLIVLYLCIDIFKSFPLCRSLNMRTWLQYCTQVLIFKKKVKSRIQGTAAHQWTVSKP